VVRDLEAWQRFGGVAKIWRRGKKSHLNIISSGLTNVFSAVFTLSKVLFKSFQVKIILSIFTTLLDKNKLFSAWNHFYVIAAVTVLICCLNIAKKLYGQNEVSAEDSRRKCFLKIYSRFRSKCWWPG
jgi:hypothetical protein